MCIFSESPDICGIAQIFLHLQVCIPHCNIFHQRRCTAGRLLSGLALCGHTSVRRICILFQANVFLPELFAIISWFSFFLPYLDTIRIQCSFIVVENFILAYLELFGFSSCGPYFITFLLYLQINILLPKICYTYWLFHIVS